MLQKIFFELYVYNYRFYKDTSVFYVKTHFLHIVLGRTLGTL